jgi:prophage regulatory protein
MNTNYRALTVLRLAQVQSRTGLRRSSIYQKISEGRFPRQISLGSRAVGWIEFEIDAWVEKQIFLSRNQSGGESAPKGTFRKLENPRLPRIDRAHNLITRDRTPEVNFQGQEGVQQ